MQGLLPQIRHQSIVYTHYLIYDICSLVVGYVVNRSTLIRLKVIKHFDWIIFLVAKHVNYLGLILVLQN